MGMCLMKALFSVEGSDEAVVTQLKKNNVVVLDVRAKGRFDAGHADAAMNVFAGYSQSAAAKAVDAAAPSLPEDKATPIVVHCDGGGQAQMCTVSLRAKGYTNVCNAGTYGRVKRLQSVASGNAVVS
jgi:phage shock protein E